MTGKEFFKKLQDLFDKIEDAVTELEARWFVFIAAVVVIMIAKALGLHGLSHLIGIMYVMYFVTFLLGKK
jgi:hypothetical protein